MKHDPAQHGTEENTGWFFETKNVNRMIIALCVVCGLLVIADFFPTVFYHDYHKHFEKTESIFAFQAMFGFVAFVCIVFIGRGLRLILKREEDYYDS